MKAYIDRSKEELLSLKEELTKKYDEYKSLNLSLNMMRGNPAPEQLDLSNKLFENFDETGFTSADGSDCRNYGVPFGLTEVRQLFADILDTEMENVIVGNSSSLNMMFDTLMRACAFGEVDSDKAWFQIEGRKWLCPVPGYDRHFKVTQQLGFDLIPVPMTENGPDMDIVEKLVSEDDKILGMWCIPVYSNPDGYVYSKETCERLCSMKTAANDFRIFWDNAYIVHHLYDDVNEQAKYEDILKLAAKCGNPNRIYEFASTSKISFAGAGLACMAANQVNLDNAKKILAVQTICSNKVNQLAHAHMFPNLDAVKERMSQHAAILRPKFEKVVEILSRELEGTEIINWNTPKGGFFVSVFVYNGTANTVVNMCKDLGVLLTPAGATYPYGKDPDDSNIRIAPSYPSIEDIDKAINVFATCVKLAAVNKILEEK